MEENEIKENKIVEKAEVKSNKSQYLTPVAILIAGAIIAGSVYLTNNNNANSVADVAGDNVFDNENSASAENVNPITLDEHIYGNPSASVSLVEYSDYECPFCKSFHETAKRIVDESNGGVRWVYRHFPLSSIHRSATELAVAGECIANLAGNDAFWAFSDAIFVKKITDVKNFLVEQALIFGISESDFSKCMASSESLQAVQEDLNNAVATGGRGTPFNIIINAEGKVFPFSGALPYPQVASIMASATAK